MMNARMKTLVTILFASLFLLNCTAVSVNVVSADVEGAELDLFTQKAPFDGEGPNQPSDAFQPQELVVLYALVTYNGLGIPNKLVGFQANNPANTFQNITVVGTTVTNEDGVAQFSFRIPWPIENAENIVFGEWAAIATVDVAGQIVLDTLAFRVGWTLQVTRITTLDVQLQPQTKFPKGDTIVFNLTIQNIAFSPKTATITVDAQDAAQYPIIHAETDSIFPSGESHMYITSQVPLSAIIGEALASAAPYTAKPENGGIPYSPSITTMFQILPPRQCYLAVATSPPGVVPIPGAGWYDQGANVTLLAPQFVFISGVAGYEFVHWNVNGTLSSDNQITVVMDANHTATAFYSLQYYLSVVTLPPNVVPIAGEGWYDEGFSVILPAPQYVSISSVARYEFVYWDIDGTVRPDNPTTVTMDASHNATAVYALQYYLDVKTEPIGIATIEGQGWYDKSENVSLTAPSVEGYDFSNWDVDGTSQGSGLTSITVLMDAPHNATAHYNSTFRGWYPPYWFYWVLPFIVIPLLLLIALLYRRRRKKESETFYSGWTAWYYRYSLPDRNTKSKRR